jgi:type IV pilus assembly protein PilC
MPVYRYQAIDHRGKSRSGSMPAPDESTLFTKLHTAGLWLTDAHKQRAITAAALSPAKLRRVKLRGNRGRRELIDFCTLMTFQIRAGITLVKALEVASQDCKNEDFRAVLQDLQNEIESGLQFHEALAKFPGVFSVHFLSVIKAGEKSSALPEAFDDLRNYLEWVERIMADVRQATLYPSIVITVIFGFTIFLFTFIIPKFADLLDKLHVPQPLLTRIVFGVGDFAQKTWWFTLPSLILMALIVFGGRRISRRIALWIDHIKLRLPVFGELNSMLALSRFAHNLSILYRSGLPILQCLNLCRQGLIGNIVIENAVGDVEEDVKSGSSISEAMHRQPVFPALVLRMVGTGESSGNLDHALENVSSYYSDVVPRKIKTIFSIMEPALMLFLIFMVGSVALAIYMPIISLMGAIK